MLRCCLQTNEMKKNFFIDISYVYDRILQQTSTRIKIMNHKNTFREKSIETNNYKLLSFPTISQ